MILVSTFKKIIKRNKAAYLALRRFRMKILCSIKGYQNIGADCWISAGQRYISKDTIIGNFGFVGRGCWIYPNVRIGRFCLLAPNVAIIGADHAMNKIGVPTCFSGRERIPETLIGDDVWIGQSAIILVGTRIGTGAIVGAGSVVTKDVPDFSVVVGNPARVIKYRFEHASERDRHLKEIERITSIGELVGDL